MVNKLLDEPYFDESEIEPQYREEVLYRLGATINLYTEESLGKIRNVRHRGAHKPVSEEHLLEQIKNNAATIAESIPVGEDNSLVNAVQELIEFVNKMSTGGTTPIEFCPDIRIRIEKKK